ncbi:MAG: PKD domain-containing protein, partial [Flavitalea sp.]
INDMGGGNSTALNNFIPGSRDFAIATSSEKVMAAFNKEKNERYNFPHTYPEKIKGKTVRLNSLDLELHNGFLEVKGNVTVVDAIADSINISADFSQNVSLHWDPDASPAQKIQHKLEGDPDIDLGAAAWILTALIGFLTFGVVGLIIGLIIVAIVQSVASQIGAQVAAGEADKFDNAWPVVLDKIGNIEAHFHNPIGIETSGLVFAGKMVITATHQSTLVDMARSNGPYFATGNQLINFNGGAPHSVSAAKWNLGNGQTQNLRSLNFRYGKSGVYVANVQIQVNEQGGVTTRHYTTVAVKNVQPVVNFKNPSLTIPEGQEVEISASFTDDNWLDKHIAIFDFGDNTAPQNGTIQQTNNEPQAQGTATIKHTWCDSGSYKLTVFVHDDAGGIGQAVMDVQVTNVPPKIIAPKKICVLRNQNVHLEAIFTDPGWCDTHVATWDTGDGRIHMATIKERHTPPALIGFASSSHVYKCIGNYIARITVTDDDGGEDSAIVFVMVTELFNANFEDGFRLILRNRDRQDINATSVIANEWYPFESAIQTASTNSVANTSMHVLYKADEFINRNGQRSQVVGVTGSGMAGIRQTVCANPGWDYEFTVYYHLPVVDQQCMLIIGIDAKGGTDPANTAIEWVTGAPSQQWVHASMRVCAQAEKITCFVGVLQARGSGDLYIDKTALYMIQPKYGALPDRRKDVENCCPIDEIESHDFNRLADYATKPQFSIGTIAKYNMSSEGVRFVSRETSGPQFMLAQPASNRMANNIIKGAAQITGAIVKNVVSGTIETVFPFLKRKNM